MSEFHCRANCNPPPVGDIVGASIDSRTAERAGMWLKALTGQDKARAWCVAKSIALKAASETLPQTAGGWLVPQDFEQEIVSVVERYGCARQTTDVRTIARDSLLRPRRVGGATMTWLPENTVIPKSQMSLDGLEIGLRKLAGMLRVSTEVLSDAASDLGAWWIREVGLAQAIAEDDCFFNGTGTSAYAGAVGLTARMTGTAQAVSAQAGHSTFASIDSTDISATMAVVIGSALPDAAWFMHPSVLANVLYRLAGTSGGLVSRIRSDGTVQAAYLGYPIYTSGALNSVAGDAKPVLWFGSMARASMLVQRHGGLVVATSTHHAADQDQVLMRVVARLGIMVHDVTPMSVLLGKS